MTGHAVAAPHHLSAQAAKQILDSGGNAVDAAIAAVAVQGVVAPETCGIGGDLFALVHRPGWDRPRALNASGRAGSAATPDLVENPDSPHVPREHPLAVTIPGCIDGLVDLSTELGKLALGNSLAPAIELASAGFEVSRDLSTAFTALASVYERNPAVSDLYPAGRPVKAGETVTRPALAETLTTVASSGRDGFYSGRAGEDIVGAVGGLISLADLEQTQSEWIEPIGVEVAGYVSWTTPPNSQGYLGPATLAVLEILDPPSDPEDPAWWHLLIESYRCLAWERDDVVSDPNSAPLPLELYLDRDRLLRAAATVSPTRAGVWPQRIGALSDTAYLCVADSEGMGVSIIQSNYHGTGSPLGAARSGFLLRDRGAGFGLTKGHPNVIAPAKRPLHTLSPTLWTSGTDPTMLLGTRGGAVQPQLVAQVAARAVISRMSLDDAVAAPRWTVQDFGPGSEPVLQVEPGVRPEILSDLRGRGHQIEELDAPQPGWGPVSVIGMAGSERAAESDPRVDTTQAIVW